MSVSLSPSPRARPRFSWRVLLVLAAALPFSGCSTLNSLAFWKGSSPEKSAAPVRKDEGPSTAETPETTASKSSPSVSPKENAITASLKKTAVDSKGALPEKKPAPVLGGSASPVSASASPEKPEADEAPAPVPPSEPKVPAEPAFTYGRTYAFDFQGTEPLGTPDDWSSFRGVWLAADDRLSPGNRVLVQTSPTAAYSRCIVKDYEFADVEVTVRMRSFSGKETIGGGIVLCYQPLSGSHYVVRADHNERTVGMFHHAIFGADDQQRFSIGTSDQPDENLLGARVRDFPAGWYTLRARKIGALVRVWVDGELMAIFDDGRILSGGRVGLWTMRDAVTAFDDFTVREVLATPTKSKK